MFLLPSQDHDAFHLLPPLDQCLLAPRDYVVRDGRLATLARDALRAGKLRRAEQTGAAPFQLAAELAARPG